MSRFRETVYYYQPVPDKMATARKAVMIRMGIRIRMVEPEQLLEQVGFVAGLPGFVSRAESAETAEAFGDEGAADPVSTEEFPEEMLLFQGFSDSRLDQLLKQLHRAKIPKTNLKAVLTQQNISWTFARLYREISEEHVRMHAQEATAVEAVKAKTAGGEPALEDGNVTEKSDD